MKAACLGLGCRSASYILYGVVSTVIWFMLVVSTLLTHYVTTTPRAKFKLTVTLARSLSVFNLEGGGR